MRVLLIGGRGQLGTDLQQSAGSRVVTAPPREALDVANPDALRAVLGDLAPTVVINCAAFHDVPRCEVEPFEAFRINAVAVRDLATACADRSIRFVTFSSDYVFGGDQTTPYAEDALPRPLQLYGITRLAGEHAALASAPEHAVVIRTCGLYGSAGARAKGGNFVDGRVAEARAGRLIDMACEQTVAPTSTHDLARAVWQLLDSPGLTPGIFHLVNEGACTWYDLARAVFRAVGSGQVNPVDRGARTGTMRRPRYSVLQNTRARRLGVTLRSWEAALADYLHTVHGVGA